MTPDALLARAVPPNVRDLCDELVRAGHRAWVVGGCVRDTLLARTVGDWDIATSAKPTEVQKVFRRVIPTGLAHGTVTVLWRGEQYEVTTLRGEGAYTDGRRPDAVFFVEDIAHDLERRDFTINAMAFDPVSGALIDPFGGLDDLHARSIRAVGDPVRRFGEDGLRVLRAARFVASLEFELDSETEASIAGSLSTFARVSKERVRDEWVKTMKARQPSRAFEVMHRTGILGVTFPQMSEQVGCAQNSYHAFDVWGHTMACLDATPVDPVLRVAALLHDVGKPATRAWSEKTNDWTFYNHEQVGAELVQEWLRSYRFSNDEREHVTALVRHHLVCYSSEWTDSAVRRFVKRVTGPRVGDLLELARADARGKGRPVERELALLDELAARIDAAHKAGDALSTRDLKVNGSDLMSELGMKPGRQIGVVLEALLERVLEEPKLNERATLLDLARAMPAAS